MTVNMYIHSTIYTHIYKHTHKYIYSYICTYAYTHKCFVSKLWAGLREYMGDYLYQITKC